MLLDQSQARQSSVSWIAKTVEQILSRFDLSKDPLFPCIFSRKAFRQEIVKLIAIPLLEDRHSYDLDILL